MSKYLSDLICRAVKFNVFVSRLNVFFDTVKLVPETFKTLVVWDFSKALFATGSLVYSIVKNNEYILFQNNYN